MNFLRHIIGLIAALLLSVLGAAAMPFPPTVALEAEFFPQLETAATKHTNVHFAARGPPMAASKVTFAGAAVVERGNEFVMHGREIYVASLGFSADLDAPNNGANNINNGIRLNHQLAAEEIAGGHGFQKHVLEQGEFAGLGIRTRQQYQDHIENVLNNPSSIRYTSDGRSFHLQESTGTVVVRNPSAPDGGTAFQPQNWNDYVSGLPTRTEPY